jgi:excinuclease ABC subunit C
VERLIASAISEQFSLAVAQPPEPVNRHKIDEAQIIYSYLKGSSGCYILIPGEWLEPAQQSVLDEAVGGLLESCFQQAE